MSKITAARALSNSVFRRVVDKDAVFVTNIVTKGDESANTYIKAGEASTTVVGKVYHLASNGKWAAAKADAIATAIGMLGVARSTTSDDGMLIRGIMTNATWSFTPGALVYLSGATAGEIVATPPVSEDAVVRIVGVALSATTVAFDPDITYSVIAEPAAAPDTFSKYITTGEEVVTVPGSIYFLGSDGKWALTKADGEATAAGLLSVANTASSDDGMLLFGIISDEGWSFTPGAPIYLSETLEGDLTDTPPITDDHIVRIIGYALSKDTVLFDPEANYTIVES